jgi:hypothetical protein
MCSMSSVLAAGDWPLNREDILQNIKDDYVLSQRPAIGLDSGKGELIFNYVVAAQTRSIVKSLAIST